MKESPSLRPECGGDCPVESLSWHMAAAFADALSASEGLAGCYSCTGTGSETECEPPEDPYSCEGYRLGTEAEWEHAARCDEGTLYAGSSDAELVAWTSSNSGSTIHPVASLAPNACGLYDMSGNVWEWVHDGYASYSEGPVTDPSGDPEATDRVRRGGGWYFDSSRARVASRLNYTPDRTSSDLGFRLFRTMP